jgi:hypothetical protein
MSQALGEKVFTYNLTNNTLKVTTRTNATKMSVFCSSATGGTITGNWNGDVELGGTQTVLSPVAVALNENETFSMMGNEQVIDGITLNAPAGCTFRVILGE